MLKAIALAGFFFAAFAVTPASNASPTAKPQTTMKAPTAPVPHGLCPGGGC